MTKAPACAGDVVAGPPVKCAKRASHACSWQLPRRQATFPAFAARVRGARHRARGGGYRDCSPLWRPATSLATRFCHLDPDNRI